MKHLIVVPPNIGGLRGSIKNPVGRVGLRSDPLFITAVIITRSISTKWLYTPIALLQTVTGDQVRRDRLRLALPTAVPMEAERLGFCGALPMPRDCVVAGRRPDLLCGEDNLIHQKQQLSHLDANGVRESLKKALASRRFQASPKIRDLLTFIVEATLAGQAGRLKSYTLGIEVFNRPMDFDAESDSIVRVSMSRLRHVLDAYYEDEGRDDPIRIRLNKGRYAPHFVHAPAAGACRASDRGRVLLAVEPLEWVGNRPDELNLAVGLTAELVAALSSFGECLAAIRAPSSASSSPDAGESPVPLGLLYRLGGTVRCHDDQYRVCLTLVEAAEGLVAWSETFSGRLAPESFFAFQEEVTRKVAAKVLDPHGILFHSLKRKPAVQLGTTLALFRYHEYQEHFSAESHRRARDALINAVAEEPGHAEAWALLAGVYIGEALFGFNRERPLAAVMQKSLEAALNAVTLEPRSVVANYNLAMAHFYRRERAQFQAVAMHALRLAPHHPNNLAIIGMHLALLGDWERGVPLVEEAARLNPFHPPWYHLVFSLHHLHGRRYAEALAALGRFAGIDFFPFQINLAVIHGHLGHLPEAGAHLERMFALWPDARHQMREILDLWFPFGDLAEVFAEGLVKAGFPFDGR